MDSADVRIIIGHTTDPNAFGQGTRRTLERMCPVCMKNDVSEGGFHAQMVFGCIVNIGFQRVPLLRQGVWAQKELRGCTRFPSFEVLYMLQDKSRSASPSVRMRLPTVGTNGRYDKYLG